MNGKDSLGCTPLMWAARNNNRGVCEVLLGLGDADPSITDSRGETSLFMASADGYEDIVKLLIDRKDVIAVSHNNGGQTPLSVAARNGHEGIVKLLRQRKDLNLGLPDNSSQSRLSLETEHRQDGAIEPRFERPGDNPATSEGYIRKNSSPVPTPSGCAHLQRFISRLFLDDCPQSQQRAPQDGSLYPESIDRMSVRRGCTLHKAWWTWLTKCCRKR